MNLVSNKLNFYATQPVTGHGLMNRFLSKLTNTSTACLDCDNPMDDSLHVLFDCPRQNEEISKYLNNLTANNHEKIFLEDHLDNFNKFANTVLSLRKSYYDQPDQ